MKTYTSAVNTRKTSQREPVPGRTDQVANSEGGYVFAVGLWERLRRFLILGTEGGTYYIGERELTKAAAGAVLKALEEDGERVVAEIVAISTEGRAARPAPAIFALALASKLGDAAARAAANRAMPKVCRTGTHLFQWLEAVKALGGWGSGTRRAIKRWYLTKPLDRLAYQLVKYQQRDGWSHRDALRLAHPKPPEGYDALLGWAARKRPAEESGSGLVAAFERAKTADEAATVRLILTEGLTREMVASQHLASASVWAALLERMPMGAMIRNLGKMTAVGLLAPASPAAKTVAERLCDVELLRKARVHPVALLSALGVYASGHGDRGSLAWSPTPAVIDALDEAFYLAFQAVESTGKRFYVGVDVSGSMRGGVAGLRGLSCAQGAAAMAMTLIQSEDAVTCKGFAGAGASFDYASWDRGEADMRELGFSRRMRLDDALRRTSAMNFGCTNCALPMLDAIDNGLEVDTFVILTDSETYAGDIQPFQALRQYREESGIPARLVVVAMAGNEFSIADPSDACMLDVVGFDAAAPRLIAEFASGNV